MPIIDTGDFFMYRRTAIAYFSLMLVFGVLIVNIFLIIVSQNAVPSSQRYSTSALSLSESRGVIYDCNMQRLTGCEAEAVTVCLPDIDAVKAVSSYLADSEKTLLSENFTDGKISILHPDINFNSQKVKTVNICKRYGENPLCVHIIGHLDENGDGALGLEKAYNSYLKLYSGSLKAVWSRDALGHILGGAGVDFESDGYNNSGGIQITIDSRIQRVVENALKEQGIDCGAAVVMNAETAEVLALASAPVFDPSKPGDYLKKENSPFLNRAITPYSVGSVFKTFVAAAALEKGVTLDYQCRGSVNVGGTEFRCSGGTVHGQVNLDGAAQKSCNCYFIELGQQTGKESLLSLCSALGFGKSTELADNFILKGGALPQSGELDSPQALSNLCFGQGRLTISPVKMAAAYSAVANGGIYHEPTLMKSLIDENRITVQRVQLPEGVRVMSRDTAKRLDKMLLSVVTDGNGKRAYSEITENRGKTATAQSGTYENGREINHTWFCGYFTFGGNTYTAVILKEDGVSGSVDCAPVFKAISEGIAQIFS